MYECTYEHTYHYLLSKVLFKYERKLVGTSVCVYVSTYVCILMILYGTLYQYQTCRILQLLYKVRKFYNKYVDEKNPVTDLRILRTST